MCAWRGGTEAPGTTWSRSFTRPACPGTGGLNGASGSGPYGVGKVFAITGVGGAPSRRSGLPTSSPSSPSCTTPPLTMLPDGPPLQPPTPQAQLPVSWTTTWCGNSAGEEVDHLRAILKVRGESLPGEGGGPGHQHRHGAAQPHKHREEGAESCDGQETLQNGHEGGAGLQQHREHLPGLGHRLHNRRLAAVQAQGGGGAVRGSAGGGQSRGALRRGAEGEHLHSDALDSPAGWGHHVHQEELGGRHHLRGGRAGETGGEADHPLGPGGQGEAVVQSLGHLGHHQSLGGQHQLHGRGGEARAGANAGADHLHGSEIIHNLKLH